MQDDRAPFGARVLATLVDLFVIALVAVTVASVAQAAGTGEETLRWVVTGAIIVTSAAYGTLLLVRAGKHNGQTFGKQLFKVRAVRADGQGMDVRTAAMREVVGKTLLALIPFYWVVDSLFPLADARRQAIHDKIAQTFVVTADAVPDFDRVTPDGEHDAFGRDPAPAPDRPAELPGGFSPPEPGRRD
jgi:uncharacterized RDD family membrane protein YckC